MLKAGTAVVDITPAAGSLMAAFPKRPEGIPRRARGAHDPIQARVLVLADGRTAVAICTFDLTAVQAGDVARLREAIAARVPALEGRQVLVTATHTHSGPETTYRFGNTPEDPWIEDMIGRAADAVARAHADLETVDAFLARPRLELTHNRRVQGPDGKARMQMEYEDGVTTGVVDPEALVLRFEATSGTKAVLFSFAAHALTLGPKNDQYSADFPGVANAHIEGAFPGAVSLFCNGAAGNVHPRACMRDTLTACASVGQALGEGVAAAAAHAEAIPDPCLAFKSSRLTFANRVDDSLGVALEVDCLALGPVVLGFVPGEFFIEFQLDFKARLAPQPAALIGYANGSVGYVPTREAYATGGYGVDLYAEDSPAISRTAVPPGAGEEAIDALVGMAHSLIEQGGLT